MITHEIKKEVPVVQQTHSSFRQPNSNWPYPNGKMDKLEYANYLKTITIKVGDVVLGTWDKCTRRDNYDVPEARYFIVSDIQEMHGMVSYVGGKPECIFIRPLSNSHPGYWINPTHYETVPKDAIPEKVKQLVNAYHNSRKTSGLQ